MEKLEDALLRLNKQTCIQKVPFLGTKDPKEVYDDNSHILLYSCYLCTDYQKDSKQNCYQSLEVYCRGREYD